MQNRFAPGERSRVLQLHLIATPSPGVDALAHA
jgi:hypothetical protein